MTEKYVLEVNTDHETGEEHCTVLKTDGTTNMANWTEIVSAMYTHHSILESLVDELNKIQNNYNNTEKYAIKLWKENEQLKQALLFFLDVANGQCSSSFQKDMEHDCQKLFNCSYDKAKKKYGGYNATWWELGE